MVSDAANEILLKSSFNNCSSVKPAKYVASNDVNLLFCMDRDITWEERSAGNCVAGDGTILFIKQESKMRFCIVGDVIPRRSDQLNVPGAYPEAKILVPEKFKVPGIAELMLCKPVKPKNVPGNNSRGCTFPVGRASRPLRPKAGAEKENGAMLERVEMVDKSIEIAAVFQPRREAGVMDDAVAGNEDKSIPL